MARYFFHTDSDVRHTDQEGGEFATIEDARQGAAELIAGILKDGSRVFWGTKPWSMTVTDGDGLILFTLEVHGQDAPSVMGAALQARQG